jgi:hypothetical protein
MVAGKPKRDFYLKKDTNGTMKIEITADWILSEYSKNVPIMDFDSSENDIVDDEFGWITLTYVSETDSRWIELALNSCDIKYRKLKFDNIGEEPEQSYNYWYDIILNFTDVLNKETELPNFIERLINWNYDSKYAYYNWLLSNK